MPIPIMPPGAAAFLMNPGTSYAARAAASSLLAAALGRNLWERTPSWVREDDVWKALFYPEEGEGHSTSTTDNNNKNQQQQQRDEMASLAAVIQKLQALVVTGYDKLGSERRTLRRRRRVAQLSKAMSSSCVVNKCNDPLMATENDIIDAGTGLDNASPDSTNVSQGRALLKKATSSFNDACAICNCQEVMCQLCNSSHEEEQASLLQTTQHDSVDDSNTRISALEWHAALLAYMQLCNQIRERYPHWRDDMYEKCNSGYNQDNGNDNIGISSNNASDSFTEGAWRVNDAVGHQEDTLQQNSSVNKTLHLDTNGENEESNLINDKCDLSEIAMQQNPKQQQPLHNKAQSNNPETKPPRVTINIDSPTQAENTTSAAHDKFNPVTTSQINELRAMLDYAVWAYEPDEELLRSLLMTNNAGNTSANTDERNSINDNKHDGFQLIVHRTTSYVQNPDDETTTTNATINSNDNKPCNIFANAKKNTKKSQRKPPGRVGYYVAVSHTQRTLLIGIKGTSTLEELLTDCCGRAIRVDLENDPHHPVGCIHQDFDEDSEVEDESLCGVDCNISITVMTGAEDNYGITVNAGVETGKSHSGEFNEVDNLVDNGALKDFGLETPCLNFENDIDHSPGYNNQSAGQEADHISANQVDETACQSFGVASIAGEGKVAIYETSRHHVEDNRPNSSNNIQQHNAMVNGLHISISNDNCDTGDLEVEVVHQYQVTTIPPSIPAPDVEHVSASFGNFDDKSNQKTQSRNIFRKSTRTAKQPISLHKSPTPTDNILLIPSNPSGDPYTTKKTQTNQQEVMFVESNGIEMEPQRSTKLRGAHEGILHCAQQLFYEIAPLVEEYAVSKGYDIVSTGHSLGAGAATLLAILIRGKYPELVVPHCVQSEEEENGHLNQLCPHLSRIRGGAKLGRQRVRAYAFASPPVLDRESALACSHYVMSIVNNADIIPRSSLTNLDVLLTVLEAVRSRLVDLGMNPGSGNVEKVNGLVRKGSFNCLPKCQNPQNAITSIIALFRKLSEGTKGELLISVEQLDKIWEEAVAEASLGDGENDGLYWDEEGDHHLFSPGVVLMMYEPWSFTNVSADARMATKGSSCEGAENSQVSHTFESRTHKSEVGDFEVIQKEKGEELVGSMNALYHAMWINGTAPMLKYFEVGGGSSIVTDHLTSSYYRALESLAAMKNVKAKNKI